ncbi:unnamed protein product, partial [Cylicocyclus nassatus]
TIYVVFLIFALVVVVAVLRRIHNIIVLKLISESLCVEEEGALSDQQLERLQKYVQEVLSMSLNDWMNYSDSVIKQPKKDPEYHRKPKKNADLRKAEAALRTMNIKMKKRRSLVRLATLPNERAELSSWMQDKRNRLHLTAEQEKAFEICTRNDDDDHNFSWCGDVFCAYHKLFIGDDQGKIIRREIPTKMDEERTFTSLNGGQIHMQCKDAFILATNVLEFNLLVRRKQVTRRRTKITQTFITKPMLYNGWPDDGFPKDLKALQKVILSIANSKQPTIVIGKSTDASCELFWMMNLVVKAVLGRASTARLTSVLEACIILLSPAYLTSHHFLYLLKFVLSWASSVGALTEQQREGINDWRNEYHALEAKAEARLYGRAYLRVISLDVFDSLCDEVLIALDATAVSRVSLRSTQGSSEKQKDKSQEKEIKEKSSSFREAAGGNKSKIKSDDVKKINTKSTAKENQQSKQETEPKKETGKAI